MTPEITPSFPLASPPISAVSPRTVNGVVDIGAFESQGFTLTPVSGSTPQSTLVGHAFANALAVTVTADDSLEPVVGGVITFNAPPSSASANLSADMVTIGTNSQASITATANSAAGDYVVTASATGVATTATFSLTNNSNQPTVKVSDAGGIYNGSAFAASATITPNDGPPGDTLEGVGITFTYYVGTGASGTNLGSTAPSNAGTYTVVADFPGSSDYNSASDSTSFTIAKANATVVVTPYTVTYDGKPHTATIASITGVNGETGATVGAVTLNTTHTSAGTYASDCWSFTGRRQLQRPRQHNDHRHHQPGRLDDHCEQREQDLRKQFDIRRDRVYAQRALHRRQREQRDADKPPAPPRRRRWAHIRSRRVTRSAWGWATI